MRKGIHWELYKRLQFCHTDKCYMHKPESVLEYKMHEILWDFAIGMSPSLLLSIICKTVRQTGLTSLSRGTQLRENSGFKTWGMLFRESVECWCAILLLSAHPKSVTVYTQTFTLVNKITYVSSWLVYVFSWDVEHSYVVHDRSLRKEMHIYRMVDMVPLFNGLSTFVDYLMPKPCL